MAVPGTVRRPDGVELAYEDTGGDGPVVLLTPYLRSFPKAGYTQEIEGALLGLRAAGVEFFGLVQSADPTARRFHDIAARFLETADQRSLDVTCLKEVRHKPFVLK